MRPKYKAIFQTNLRIMEDTHEKLEELLHMFRKNVNHFNPPSLLGNLSEGGGITEEGGSSSDGKTAAFGKLSTKPLKDKSLTSEGGEIAEKIVNMYQDLEEDDDMAIRVS